ncbi:MAG: mannose-1-phosphate guanylyltransferase/mannose-6-phosphate isomerase [Candidatus Saelkia tenebricola]|nr:mannose-1-phosphate guanylyltransferase/mannose-6-phosphate isomerase [Candidatus Saelkia tenebricola]
MKIAILAGGSGTRLWPLSRKDYPKQFIKINSKHSFFQSTVLRCLKGVLATDIIVSAHKDYKFHTISDLMKIMPRDELPHLIFEPESKNTFGALIGILNFCLMKLNLSPQETIAILPSDHIISPVDKFQDYLDLAEESAADGSIVVFGITPGAENTGYGHIKTGENLGGSLKVEEFIEKPPQEVIEKLMTKNQCFWNSGMFCFQIEAMVNEIKEHVPDAVKFLSLSWDEFLESFSQLPSVSIDNAIMEKTKQAVLIPVKDLYWNDIGSFQSLYEMLDKDTSGNVKIGDVVVKNSSNSFLLSSKRLVSAIGVKDLLVIETDDAILITTKDGSQNVKELVQQLKEDNRREVFEHVTHYRPWGSFTILEEGNRYKIKRVVVNSGERLSLQLHKRRSEHWVIVKGEAKVTIADVEKTVKENESVYVPISTRHRLENISTVKLELIEVQNGDYLGEDDIERFEDKYQDIRSE